MVGPSVQGWRIDVVRVSPDALCRGRQVCGVIDEDAHQIIYQVDTSAPEETWMRALSDCMTEMVQGWMYVGDVRVPESA